MSKRRVSVRVTAAMALVMSTVAMPAATFATANATSGPTSIARSVPVKNAPSSPYRTAPSLVAPDAIGRDLGVGLSNYSFKTAFDASLKSRSWRQSAGDTDVVANVSCTDNNFSGHYVVRLYKDGFFSDSQQGPTVTYRCGSNQTFTFTGLGSGTYYWIMSQGGYSPYNGAGHVTYPTAYTHDGIDPATFTDTANPAETLKTVYTPEGRKIELRHLVNSPGTTWARISNGSRGDRVWIDRSADGGANWKGLMYMATVSWGYTQKYTYTVDKVGTAVVRACGTVSNGTTRCTPWVN